MSTQAPENGNALKFNKVEYAREAYEAAKRGWRDASTIESEVRTERRYSMISLETLVGYTATAYANLIAVKAAAIAEFGDIEKAAGCASCLEQQVFPGGPRHQASARCRSGGHPHCSCDTCW